MIIVRKKFGTLQETTESHSQNDEYENFVTTYREAAAECTPIKPRAKCRVPLKPIAVRKKWNNMRKTYLLNKRNPTRTNIYIYIYIYIKDMYIYICIYIL